MNNLISFNAEQIEELKKMGKKWESKDKKHTRIYFNKERFYDYIGLTFEKRETGSINWAKICDENISATHAANLIAYIDDCNLYVDLTKNELNCEYKEWMQKYFKKEQLDEILKLLIDDVNFRASRNSI